MARLVTHFATRPDETRHMRALQRATGLTPRSLQTELARLVRLGILRRHTDGRQVKYGLDEQSPRWRALRGLLRELADPAEVVREALADVAGVEAAFLFGSYARGTDIRDSSDIDLFVMRGDLSEDLLSRRTLDTSVLLGREVNTVTTNYDELLARVMEGSGFYRAIMTGPKRWLVGAEAAIERALAEINKAGQ